jgi:hypothetical protein
MTEPRKLSKSLIFTLATLALIGSAALVGLLYTARWYANLPPEALQATLPPAFYFSGGKLLLQFFASAVGFFFILYGRAKAPFNAGCFALLALLLAHLADWPGAIRMATLSGSSPLLVHGVRLLIAIWFGALFVALVPNSSFKPKPLRGSP